MTDLTDWLRSALDEHERIAHKWFDRRCDGCGKAVAARGLHGLVKCTDCDPSDLPLSNDATLRTVRAHREILDRYATALISRDAAEGTVLAGATRLSLRIHTETLRSVAAIYRDHPGFDPSWLDA